MKTGTKEALDMAYNWCRANDKSDAFMIQFLQDNAKVNLDAVVSYLKKKHKNWNHVPTPSHSEETETTPTPKIVGWETSVNENGVTMATLSRDVLVDFIKYHEIVKADNETKDKRIEELEGRIVAVMKFLNGNASPSAKVDIAYKELFIITNQNP